MLDVKKIEAAINQISAEKKISKENLIDIIESAIKTAYKKDYGTKDENVIVASPVPDSFVSVPDARGEYPEPNPVASKR